MGGDGIIDFEESNHEDLLEKFKEKYRSNWESFVYEQYIEHTADLPDMINDEGR